MPTALPLAKPIRSAAPALDAREVLAECRAGSLSSDECSNADVAMQTIEGREKFERFRRRD
jgi:hypothetical protein